MIMAHSMEGRVPFLDHKLMEFAARIPQNLKLKGMKDKYIIRKTMSRIVPKIIMKRKKHRFFVPIDTWFEGELWEVIKQIFSEEIVNKLGLFKYSYINHILKNYSKSKLFYARQLWNLLNFEIWRRIFIERENLKKPKFILDI